MFRDKKILLIVGLLLAAPAIFVGCGDDREAKNKGVVEKVMDSVALSVAENLDKARIRSTDSVPVDSDAADSVTPAIDLAVKIEDENEAIPAIHDMIVNGTIVHAVFDGGLLIYDLKSDEYSVTTTGGSLRAIAEHAGTLYAGGDGLYEIDGENLLPVEVSLPGKINELYSYGPSLMVGTTEGLYAKNVLGTMLLLDEKNVTAIAENGDGLWIGTDGDGLYCFDGERYRRRYLTRDPSLFDNITTLEAGHNHLYLGTTEALYVFDGGSWTTIGVEQGLPSGHVTSVDASDWVVYVGTTSGVISLFNGEIDQVDRLDNKVITSVRKSGYRLLAGTGQSGLMVKSGPAIRTITEPWEMPTDLAALWH